MRKLLTIILLLVSLSVGATNYYVSNAGNDSNNGTTTSTPWATLARASSQTYVLGDNLALNRGDTFYGSLQINNSGTIGSPITITSYGTGAKPILSGFDTLTGWTNNGDGTWSVTDANLSTTYLNMVTINGTLQSIGRFPKVGYRTYTAFSGYTSITDATLANTPSFVGGEVVIRKLNYITDRGNITSQSSGVITYIEQPNDNNVPGSTGGYGYFFQNNINCLTEFGDWMYNPSTHIVTMYFGVALPTSYTIKASRYENVINIPAAQSNIVIDGLSIEGANSHGVGTVDGISYLTVTNCTINNIGVDGIKLVYNIIGSSDHITVTNCTISNTNDGGFYGANCTNTIIANNDLTNIAIIAGRAQSGAQRSDGIRISGQDPAICYNNVITNNRLRNVGFNGLAISGDSYFINGNYINNFASVMDDAGGIYTTSPSAAAFNYVYKNRVISNNMISNGIGATAGRPAVSYCGNCGISQITHGIYTDDYSNGIEVKNNVIFNMPGYGIFTHKAYANNMHDNQMYNTNGWGVQLDAAQFQVIPTTGLIFKNNSIFSLTGQTVVDFINYSTDNMQNMGIFNNNVYSRPSDETTDFRRVMSGATYYSLTGWKAYFTNYEANSKITPIQFQSPFTSYFIYTNPDVTVSQSVNATYQELTGRYSFNRGETMTVPLLKGAIMLKVGGDPVYKKIFKL